MIEAVKQILKNKESAGRYVQHFFGRALYTHPISNSIWKVSDNACVFVDTGLGCRSL